jgi:hypothetical protein
VWWILAALATTQVRTKESMIPKSVLFLHTVPVRLQILMVSFCYVPVYYESSYSSAPSQLALLKKYNYR